MRREQILLALEEAAKRVHHWNEDQTLQRELLAVLRSRPQARIANVLDDNHNYGGEIPHAGVNRVVQEVDLEVLVIHDSTS